jgi:hypothetical protein
MAIKVEYNPDLALRNILEFKEGRRKKDECIPEVLEVGGMYPFLKRGQRNYWLYGEIPLVETKGGEMVSNPKASILILEATHFMENGEIYTRGSYKVLELCSEKGNCKVFTRIGIKK